MRITDFACLDLNTFITRKIAFFDDVSFLHGINGSGKTTILRAIASLLTPDPIWLANAAFRSIEIQLEHDESALKIAAAKTDQTLNLTISGSVNLASAVSVEDARRLGEEEDDLFRLTTAERDSTAGKLRAFNEKYEVLSFIDKLPTPIFLGLDRTTLTSSATTKLAHLGSRSRALHPYFRTQLDDAIFEAERLLSRQLSTLSTEKNRIFAQLRNQLVLSLFVAPREVAGTPTE